VICTTPRTALVSIHAAALLLMSDCLLTGVGPLLLPDAAVADARRRAIAGAVSIPEAGALRCPLTIGYAAASAG